MKDKEEEKLTGAINDESEQRKHREIGFYPENFSAYYVRNKEMGIRNIQKFLGRKNFHFLNYLAY